MPRLDRASRGAPSPSRVRAGEPSQAMPDAAAVARRVSMGRRSVMTGEGALRVVDEVPVRTRMRACLTGSACLPLICIAGTR